MYGRDNTKQTKVPYFHRSPLNKMKKENEMLGGCEKLIRSNSKEKKLKKN